MRTEAKKELVVICCAVFKAEILALKDRYWRDMVIHFQSSMLHMKPDKLAIQLDLLVSKEVLRGRNVLLIYGDCCMKMEDLTRELGVVRVCGNNCCDLILGRDAYRRLSHEGSFFLFPEWARRWRHIFRKELGLNPVNATSLMRDMHRKLVYIDTGVLPVPVSDLEECSRYCGLPWEVLQISLEFLRISIQTALDKLDT